MNYGNIASLFKSFHQEHPPFLDITKYGHEQYQDIIIDNLVVKKASGNHCSSEIRYEVIRKVLDKYRRPFDMLDIGASQGYYSFRAAHDYDCVCVMLEGNNPEYPKVGTQLLDLCEANHSLGNIILLNKMIIPEDLKRLSECENFDVVLALNIIHWFGSRWKEVADAILGMGRSIIIETPPQEKHASQEQNDLRNRIEKYLLFMDARMLGEVPRHTTAHEMAKIYLIESEKNRLAKKQWLSPKSPDNDNFITSNYHVKTITKFPPHSRGITVREWKPGINLMTYLMYGGAYPSRKRVMEALRRIQEPDHNDWTVNNMILQGDQLSLIDWDDPVHGPDGGRWMTPRVLNAHLHLVGLREPRKIEHYFWNHLIKT